MKLSRKQTQAIEYLEDTKTNDLLFGGGAGGGKSAFGCFWQIKRRLQYPHTRGLIGRAVLKTLKETTLITFFEVAAMQNLKAGVHFRYNGQSNQIEFANKSVILLKDLFQYPSDPNFDELGSLEITDAFVDEANQVTEKARNILKSRIRYKLDDYSLIPKCLYTCNPAKNWTYSEFYQPHKEGSLTEDKRFIQSLIDDNPFISKHYKDSLLKLDANTKQRLLYGNWEYDDDPAALIDYEKILDCFKNSHLARGKAKADHISIDVARFGNDKTVFGIWYSKNHVKLFQYKGKDVTETAAIAKEYQQKLWVSTSNVVADEDGVGGGVVDILGCKGFVNNSSPLPNPVNLEDENYRNLKSQCYFRLAERINKGELYIECDDTEMKADIIQELEQVKQYNMDKDSKRQVLPKDKVKEIIGRSPDYSDTLMMREIFDLVPQFQVAVA